MKEIKIYETEDGYRFDDVEAAIEHEKYPDETIQKRYKVAIVYTCSYEMEITAYNVADAKQSLQYFADDCWEKILSEGNWKEVYIGATEIKEN